MLLAEPGAETHRNKIFQFKAQLQAAVDFSPACPFVAFETLCAKCYSFHIKWDSANIKTHVLTTDTQCLHNFKAFLSHSAAPESSLAMSEGIGMNPARTADPNLPKVCSVKYNIKVSNRIGRNFLKYLLLEDWLGIDLVAVRKSFCTIYSIIEVGRNF